MTKCRLKYALGVILCGICLWMFAFLIASADDIPAVNLQGHPNKQYFQTVANKWVHVDELNSNWPTVLKGQVTAGPDSYILGAGDTLSIMLPDIYKEANSVDLLPKDGNSVDLLPSTSSFFQDPTTSFDIVIRPTGEASIPPFGVYKISGMTVSELTQMLQEMCRYYLLHPKVSVSIKTLRPYTVYIMGEVAQPGTYQALNSPEQADRSFATSNGQVWVQQLFETRVSLMIDKAGGILAHSDLAHVRVTNAHTGKDITLDLNRLLQGDASQDVILDPDDVVFIPKMIAENSGDTLAATIGASTYTVQVLGYITKPSGISNTNGVTLGARSMTALNALSRVVTDPEADLTRLVILRKKPNSFQFDKIVFNGLEADMPLKPYDVLIVPHQKRSYQTRLLIQLAGQSLFSPLAAPLIYNTVAR